MTLSFLLDCAIDNAQTFRRMHLTLRDTIYLSPPLNPEALLDTSMLQPNTPPPIPTPSSVGSSTMNELQVKMESITLQGAISCLHTNGTFIIRDRGIGFILALRNGIPALRSPNMASDTSAHWRCVENDDLWLGFKSVASGRYLGHNNRAEWRLVARSEYHDNRELFCARQHPDGGSVLLVGRDGALRVVKAGEQEQKELVVSFATVSLQPTKMCIRGCLPASKAQPDAVAEKPTSGQPTPAQFDVGLSSSDLLPVYETKSTPPRPPQNPTVPSSSPSKRTLTVQISSNSMDEKGELQLRRRLLLNHSSL
ncbi:uncharacterized protein BDV14DRAFT_198949 [Aspergillus stella-maris]|uniref:uncharacterized protein n=1 Tax=Aspergillus stella-maris TaxID=1810926 RepID=UPI003CCDE2E5